MTEPRTIGDLLTQMDAAGVQRGWLLSTAYLAQSPFMSPAAPDAAGIVRAANAFTVQTARDYPDRISAFIAVDPGAPDALAEIAHWAGDPAVTGLKLHLTSAAFDFANAGQVSRLAAIVEAASRAGWAMVLHLRPPSPTYGAQEVEVFVADVLPRARGAPVVIAHVAGWSGLDAATLEALDAFADAIERDPVGTRSLYFDLSAATNDQTTPEQRDVLVALIRRIGVERFLPGSDWPFAADIASDRASARLRLPLSEDEWRIIDRGTVARAAVPFTPVDAPPPRVG